ncbi:MAG: hypothetical protein Q4G68_09370 [Planctomycetia bacterium]|nr:hypothetical protein [Planctomycetia bacterium]
MRTIIILSLLSVSILWASGCNRGPQPPADMPKLTPCSVTVVTDDGPLVGATIDLYPASGEPGYDWLIQGRTDEIGKATIRTQDRFEGCPAGDFRVMVTKTVSETSEATSANLKVKSYSLVDAKYSDRATTPLTLTVGDSPCNEKFELGPSKKILISQPEN